MDAGRVLSRLGYKATHNEHELLFAEAWVDQDAERSERTCLKCMGSTVYLCICGDHLCTCDMAAGQNSVFVGMFLYTFFR